MNRVLFSIVLVVVVQLTAFASYGKEKGAGLIDLRLGVALIC